MTIMFTRTSAAGLALAASFMGAPLGLAQATKQAEPPPQQVDSALASRVGATAASWDALAKEFGGYKSETKPSRDAVMQFAQSGEIRLISVAGGQRVKRGDVLARVRDAEVVAAIARQKVVAENRLEIDNAEKQLELAVFRFEQLKAGKTFSPAEFEELRISAEVARIQRDQAKVNLEAQKIALDQLFGQAERYRLEAPFDGVIEEVMVEVGQGVTENEKVLRIVNTETLWLDAYAGTSETVRLGIKENSPVWVLVELADAPRLVKGSVLYISPVADAVSQTRRVRVEIENREDWPAGTQARVRFSEPSDPGVWEKYMPQGGTRAKTASGEPPLVVQAMIAEGRTGNNVIPCGLLVAEWLEYGEMRSTFPGSSRVQCPLNSRHSFAVPPEIALRLPQDPSDAQIATGTFIIGEPKTLDGEPTK